MKHLQLFEGFKPLDIEIDMKVNYIKDRRENKIMKVDLMSQVIEKTKNWNMTKKYVIDVEQVRWKILSDYETNIHIELSNGHYIDATTIAGELEDGKTYQFFVNNIQFAHLRSRTHMSYDFLDVVLSDYHKCYIEILDKFDQDKTIANKKFRKVRDIGVL